MLAESARAMSEGGMGEPTSEQQSAVAAVLERAPVAALYVDSQGRILHENQRMRSMLGLGPDDGVPLAGTPLTDVPSVRAAGLEPVVSRILAGEALSMRSVRMDSLYGRRLDVDVEAAPVLGSSGEVTAAVFWLSPAGALVETEAADGPAADDGLSGLVAETLHDANNLLTTISARIEVAEHLIGSGLARGEHLRAALGQVVAVRELLRRLHQSVRVGRTVRAALRIDALLGSVAEQLGQDAASLGIPARVRIDSSLPPGAEFVADGSDLQQALMNLGQNALHALTGRADAEIVLQAALVPVDGTPLADTGGIRDVLALRVVDNGPGVPGERRERVFEPYFTTREQGTGLGLAVVDRVAWRHGGAVQLVDTPGGGATFEFFVRTDLPPTMQPDEPRGDELEGVDVLLAGRTVPSAALRAAGARVAEVSTRDEVEPWLASLPVEGAAVVLVGERLAGVVDRGADVLHWSRQRPATGFVLTHAGRAPGSALRAADGRLAYFLPVPCAPGDLRRVVASAAIRGPS